MDDQDGGMMERNQMDRTVVDDDDIQAIIDQGEAGTDDLIEAYEPVEREYFRAVQHGAPGVTYSIDTSPR